MQRGESGIRHVAETVNAELPAVAGHAARAFLQKGRVLVEVRGIERRMSGGQRGTACGNIGETQISQYVAERLVKSGYSVERPETGPHPGACAPPPGVQKYALFQGTFRRGVDLM